MSTWPDTRLLDLLNIEVPIIQAPMAVGTTTAMVIAANKAGALGSLPAAALSIDQLREALTTIRQASSRPVNVNFFCHQPPAPDAARDRHWKELLQPYYRENLHRRSPQGKGCDDPARVANTTGGNDRHADCIDNLRR